VRLVGCQKVCSSAVVGVRHGGSITWLEKVKGRERRDALTGFVRGGATGKLPKVLRSLVVRKRADQLRG